jgi:hypothetical protein
VTVPRKTWPTTASSRKALTGSGCSARSDSRASPFRGVELEELARHPLTDPDDFLGRAKVAPGQLWVGNEPLAGKRRVAGAVVQGHEDAERLDRRDGSREHLARDEPAEERPEPRVPGSGSREPDSALIRVDGHHSGGDPIAGLQFFRGRPAPVPVLRPDHPGSRSRDTVQCNLERSGAADRHHDPRAQVTDLNRSQAIPSLLRVVRSAARPSIPRPERSRMTSSLETPSDWPPKLRFCERTAQIGQLT